MNEYNYCPVCGEELGEKDDGERTRPACGNCGFVHYRNPAPTAGVLVVRDGSVLLVKRRYEPYRGMWVLPSGYIEYGEDAETTALRELREETGLIAELDGIDSVVTVFDDPRGNTVMVLYEGHITGGELEGGDDAEEAAFFPLGELPPVAFEAQRRILGRVSRGYLPESGD
jgi:ADP-ribose pyrophosphatase YjhB (NUDIX family)